MPEPLIEVARLEHQHGRVLRLWFTDGTVGEVDFSAYLGRGPIYAPLRDIETIRQARVEAGAVAFPGDLDIAPESLYKQATAATTAA